MITVFKYVIDPCEVRTKLPVGAEILSVAFQRGVLCIWAKVDTDSDFEFRDFQVFGTGHKMPPQPHKFVGTAFADNGFVFHVFECLGHGSMEG